MLLDNNPRAPAAPDPATAKSRIEEIDRKLISSAGAKDRAGLLLNKATLLQVLDHLGEAREALRLALEQTPDDPETRLVVDYLQGLFCHQEGNASQAYLLLTKALSKHAEMLSRPDYRFAYEDIQQRRAFELFALRDCKNAIPVLEEILLFDLASRDRSAALANLGSCNATLKNFEAARKYLEQALEVGNLQEWEGTVHFDLALTYACLHLLQESKHELELCAKRAAEYHLSLEKIYGWLARVCKGLGEKSESEHYARLARPC